MVLARLGPLIAVLLIAALPVGCSNGSPSPTPDPSETASSSPAHASSPAAPSPTATPAPELRLTKDLVAVEPVPLPPGLVLYAIDPVWEGPTPGLRRYYRDANGQFRAEALLMTTYDATFGEGSRAMIDVVFGGPGQVAAAMCHGTCYGAPAPVTYMRSNDSGVTWSEIGTLPEVHGLLGIAGDQLVLIAPGGECDQPYTYPAGTPLPAAQGSCPRIVVTTQAGSAVVAAISRDGRQFRPLDGAGNSQPLPVPVVKGLFSVIPLSGVRAGPLFQVEWVETAEPESAREGYLALVRPGAAAPDGIYRWRRANGLDAVFLDAFVSETVAIGRVSFPTSRYGAQDAANYPRGLPALIDFEAGTVAPIAEFMDYLVAKAGGPAPRSVFVGPFAIVRTPGDCLNVRREPGITSEALGCFADRVLLPLTGATRTVDSREWLAVRTPDGRDGWAARQFLEVPFPHP